MSEFVAFSVVYATCENTIIAHFQLPSGSTVAEALALAQSSQRFPPISLTADTNNENALRPAIFGQHVALATPLQEGDRIELLRPLRCDPKENRRQRARTRR